MSTQEELRKKLVKSTHEWIRDCGLDVQDIEPFIDRELMELITSYTEKTVADAEQRAHTKGYELGTCDTIDVWEKKVHKIKLCLIGKYAGDPRDNALCEIANIQSNKGMEE